jgi:hypothetical protein
MSPIKPQSLADKEAEARKDSVLLNFAYHGGCTRGRMVPQDCPKARPEIVKIFSDLVDAAMKTEL